MVRGHRAPLLRLREPALRCPYLGRLRIYRSLPPDTKAFGSACRGTLGGAPRSGVQNLGPKGVRLHLSGAPPGMPAVLLLGLSRTRWGGRSLPLPLDPFFFRGCRLFTSIDCSVVTRTGTRGNDRGYASVVVPIPLARPWPPYVTVHGQWIATSSGALSWRH